MFSQKHLMTETQIKRKNKVLCVLRGDGAGELEASRVALRLRWDSLSICIIVLMRDQSDRLNSLVSTLKKI